MHSRTAESAEVSRSSSYRRRIGSRSWCPQDIGQVPIQYYYYRLNRLFQLISILYFELLLITSFGCAQKMNKSTSIQGNLAKQPESIDNVYQASPQAISFVTNGRERT
jgi:hypothetical protein